jgi:hypothetical protein
MFVEYQTSARNILQGFRYALRDKFCYVAHGPFKAGADSIYLNTIIVPETTEILVGQAPVTIIVQAPSPATIQGQTITLDQPLQISFGRVSSPPWTGVSVTLPMGAVPAGPTVTLLTALQCRLHVKLRVSVYGGNLRICFDQSTMVLPPAVPVELQEAMGSLASFIQGWLQMCSNIPLAPLALSETASGAGNVGVAASADRGFIAIRVELGPAPPTAAAWIAFHNGELVPRLLLQGRLGFFSTLPLGAWAHFVDRELVERAVAGFLSAGLTKSPDYKLESPVSAHWSAPNKDAHVDTSVTFRLPNACQCAFWDVDLVGDFHMGISFEVANNNELTLKGDYGYEITSDAAKDCCVATLSVAWPFIGDEELGKLKMNRLEWFVGLVQGPIILGIGLDARFKNQQLGADQLGSDCTTTEPWTFTCKRQFQFGQGPAAHIMTLKDLAGQPDGLVLLGDQIGIPQAPLANFRGEASAFTWDIKHPSCSAAGPGGLAARHASPFSFFLGRAHILVFNTASDDLLPSLPLIVHDTHVIGDDLKVFGVGKLTGGPNTYNLEVLCGYPPIAYKLDPYPCTILFQTSAGLRTVTVLPPPVLNKTEAEARSEVEADFWEAVNHCSAISDPLARLKIKSVWLVDPPPPWIRDRERLKWTLLVEGREPGHEVTVLDAAENIVARAMAPVRGMTELSFITRAREIDVGVVSAGNTMVRTTRVERQEHEHLPDVSEVGSRLKIVQTSLIRGASLDVRGEPIQLLPASHASGRGIVVVLPDRLSLYDMSVPAAPALAHEYAMDGIAGASHDRDGSLMVWGDAGLLRFSTKRGEFEREEAVATDPVRSLVKTDGGWLALSERGIERRNADLAQGGRLEVASRRAVRMFASRRHDVVVHDDGAVTYLPRGANTGTSTQPVDIRADWRLSAPVEFAGRSMVFAPSTDRGGVVVDFESTRGPQVVAWYRDDPWFWRALTIGDLTVTVRRPGRLVVYQTFAERVL